MAIRTVDASNVADYIAERTARGPDLTNPQQVIEAVTRIEAAKASDREPTPGNPVITSGEETVEASPDPGKQEPTAAQVEKAKAGTDPGVQKRIDRAIAAQKEAEEFAEEEYNARLRAERAVQDLQKEVESLRAAQQPVVKEEELVKPDPNDPKFTTVADYLKAKDEYDDRRLRREIEKARNEERQRTLMERENELLAKRIEVAKSSIPDFVEVIEAADRVKVELPVYVQNFIRASDLGPQVAYHLAKYPDEQKKILSMRPELALAALGRLEAKYEKPAEQPATQEEPPQKVATTRAPAPIQPIRTGEATVETDLSKPMPFEQYKRLRDESRRRSGRRH